MSITYPRYLGRIMVDMGGKALSLLSSEEKYLVEDEEDEQAAIDAVRAAAPAVKGLLVRGEITVEELTYGRWDATVQYVTKNAKGEVAVGEEAEVVGSDTYSFDTGGGSQHITHCLEHVATYGDNAPDAKGGIGVTEDGVEGVDITVPVFSFSETHIYPAAYVDAVFKAHIYDLTGKVSNAPFLGVKAYECLFMGASGSRRADGDVEITFRFAASPNKTGIVVGDITGIAKKGWEYMWVRYADEADETAGVLVRRPVGVYIEKVYEYANFELLGLGGVAIWYAVARGTVTFSDVPDDEDTIVIGDGATAVTFEMDADADPGDVGEGNVRVKNGVTAAASITALVAAINGSGLDITAYVRVGSDGTTAYLERNTVGLAGNVPITGTTGPNVTVTGMSGGLG